MISPQPTRPTEPFSDQLERWLTDDQAKTLGSLRDVFAERSFAVTILVLMFLPALPLPTGGITHVFEGIAVVVASQMVLGRRTLWLPARWRSRELGPLTTDRGIPFMVRWVRRCERFSRPRGVWFFRSDWSSRVLGLVLVGLAVSAALAPPFSGLDTLPAMGAVAVALSIILEDMVLLAIGVVVGSGGALVILTIGSAVLHVVRDLF
ncbi:MAG: exopolysaccharide biosynthesis protein [Microthrixaceae bacterium]